MKRELGERGRHGESSRKTRRRRRSSDEEEDDERSDYKVERNLSLSNCSFRSPPNNSSPPELKSLLLRFDSHPDSTSDYIHWYHINNNTTPTTTTTTTTNTTMVTHLTPICTIPPSSCFGTNCASALLDSKLFMFGGIPSNMNFKTCLNGCSDVFSADFNGNVDQNEIVCRKETFQMLAKRCHPAATATHTKIFIFGSNYSATPPKPWAEVFDPNLNLFSPLPEPPLCVTKAFGPIFITVVDNGDTILLSISNDIFSFNVITKSWGQLSATSPLLRIGWSYRAATLDDVLFTYNGGCVHAYDLIQQKWYKKPVLDFATASNIPPFDLMHGHVVCIGSNTLCVVWLVESHQQSNRSITCVNFQVVRERNSKGKCFLRAQVHSRTDYLLPMGYYFYDCLAL